MRCRNKSLLGYCSDCIKPKWRCLTRCPSSHFLSIATPWLCHAVDGCGLWSLSGRRTYCRSPFVQKWMLVPDCDRRDRFATQLWGGRIFLSCLVWNGDLHWCEVSKNKNNEQVLTKSKLVDGRLVVDSRFVVHTPCSVDEFQLTVVYQVLDSLFDAVALLYPPFFEESCFYLDESKDELYYRRIV